MRFFKDSKMILHIAMPLLSSRIMNVVVFFAGFIMIAKLGPKEFAAGSLANSIFVTIIMIGVGILYATGIKMSHAYGANDYKRIRDYFYSSIFLALTLGCIAVAVLLGISFLLPYLGQEPSLIPYAKQFMYSISLPMIPAMLSIVGNQLVTALLKPRIIFLSSIINVPITIGCLHWLIFGGLGIPPLGIWGFGISFFIGDIFLILIPIIYVIMNPYFKQFHLFDFSGVTKNIWPYAKEILKLGLPMGVQFGTEIAAFSVTTFLIGLFGIPALNAYQIATQIAIVALMIPLTISEAASILVGQAVGRKDPDDIRNYGFSSAILGVLLLCLVSVLFFLIPKLFINIYINVKDPALAPIVSLSVYFLYVVAFTQIFDGIRNIITGSLRGLHDSKYPMYIGILISWLISIPIGMLLAFTFKMGPIGFQYGGSIAILVGAIILWLRFNRKSKPENINYLAHSH